MPSLLSSTPLTLSDGQSVHAVDVHALVLLSILDQHLRRSEVAAPGTAGAPAKGAGADRAIGVLLGHVTAGVVEVTNAFGVLHVQHEGEVLIRRAAVSELLALHKKVNDKETVVGWYSTATGAALLDEASLVIHTFFSENFCPKPVHLCVDTRLIEDRIDAHAYITNPNALTKNVLVAFHELKTTVVASAEARVSVDAMMKPLGGAVSGSSASASEVAPDIEALSCSMRRLKGLLDAASAYVDDVVAGRAPADEALGRLLAETLSAVPTVDAAGFDRAFTSALRDVLMTSYLTSVTAVQMKLAERISAVAPPVERAGDGGRGGGQGRR